MDHVLDIAPPDDVVPSEWAMVCVVGAPQHSHRVRAHVRLTPGTAATIDLPVALTPESTRIQIEIETSWPAIVTIEDVSIAVDAGAAFAPVSKARLHAFNGTHIDTTDGLRTLSFAGTLVVQISGVDPTEHGPGARMRLALRRETVEPLSTEDPVLAAFARPERALRAGIAALNGRAKVLQG